MKQQKEKYKLPPINKMVRDWAKYQNTSLRKLSLRMGQSETYLNKILRRRDIRPTLLITLSKWLNINLLEPYLLLLPEDLQTTEREKLLHKKIESLETELEKTKEELKKTEAERDKYWEKIGR